MTIKRKFAYASADVKEYWLPRAMNFLGALLYWGFAVLAAVLTLPMSKEKRTRCVASLTSKAGSFFWALRGSNLLRELFPPMRNLVCVTVYAADGAIKMQDFGFNLRTNEGRDLNADRLGKASAVPAQPNFVAAHSSSGYTPNVTDVIGTWDGVQIPASSGFGRQVGAYVHSVGAVNYTLEANYAASATVTAYGAALLNSSGPTGGTTFCIKNFGTPASMIASDTLKITWDITI